eukprot:gene1114-294_t
MVNPISIFAFAIGVEVLATKVDTSQMASGRAHANIAVAGGIVSGAVGAVGMDSAIATKGSFAVQTVGVCPELRIRDGELLSFNASGGPILFENVTNEEINEALQKEGLSNNTLRQCTGTTDNFDIENSPGLNLNAFFPNLKHITGQFGGNQNGFSADGNWRLDELEHVGGNFKCEDCNGMLDGERFRFPALRTIGGEFYVENLDSDVAVDQTFRLPALESVREAFLLLGVKGGIDFPNLGTVGAEFELEGDFSSAKNIFFGSLRSIGKKLKLGEDSARPVILPVGSVLRFPNLASVGACTQFFVQDPDVKVLPVEFSQKEESSGSSFSGGCVCQNTTDDSDENCGFCVEEQVVGSGCPAKL